MGKTVKYQDIEEGMDLKVTYYNEKGGEKAVFYGYIAENRAGEGQYIMYVNKVEKGDVVKSGKRSDIDFRADYVEAQKVR
jgi:hypothetical protein